MLLRRHDLLRVQPDGWPEILAGVPDFHALADEPRRLVANWAARGWPVIVRRRSAEDDATVDVRTNIPVGLPLPPAFGKLRLTFSVRSCLVTETVAAVSLSEAVASAPAAWLRQVEEVIALGERLALHPTLFGAMLWQHVTGLPYIQAESAVDLIWPTPAAHVLTDLLDSLDGLDIAGPARLDGEVIHSAGGGVNWRELREELRSPAGAVLVKSMHGAHIRWAHSLFT
jgi:phosphoribosyl-dephospho-CoA transferase